MITVKDLLQIAGHNKPNATTAAIADAFNKYAAQYHVDGSKRISQFLANVAIETGGFTKLEESLNYSVEGLLNGFGRHRISEADARRMGRTPLRKADQRGIANIVYGGSWGAKNLGNTRTNDGWDFRGSGPGQITGRGNFERVARETGIDVVSEPDLLRTADTGTKAALILWDRWGLNDLADNGETTAIRKRWNGGENGLAEVRAAYARARRLPLSVPAEAPAAAVPTPAPRVTIDDSKPGSFWAALARLFTAK